MASGRICSARPIRVDYLDPLVWDTIAELLKTPEVVFEGYVRRQKKQNTEGGDIEEQLKTGQRKVKRAETEIQHLLDAYQAGLLELNELQQRTSTVRLRLKMWQNRIPHLGEH